MYCSALASDLVGDFFTVSLPFLGGFLGDRLAFLGESLDFLGDSGASFGGLSLLWKKGLECLKRCGTSSDAHPKHLTFEELVLYETLWPRGILEGIP